ncbi:SLC13 family permease [Pseudemcibacter aquimaris]|uniref:SLC13 family permease n=1 Tax=Pseudemcibacter aquimaris TaxID=2857064 RepID=UPI0020126C23|nr:SLC13 family permease [Pseudemcibacter aquimaris]MCC3860781.1 SLC13 family permease [Pseudemcibacter aquimaris]WDU59601.1 SLC13 family permease [Pseudemcibacter aquimaris]
MSQEQISIIIILAGVFIFFLWGRWRYDVVAFSALMISVLTGVIDAESAFNGFSHPAVITVAAVLVISSGLAVSGVIDRIAHIVVPPLKNLFFQISIMSSFSAILSAMMNNVAALALLMPATIDSAKKVKRSPALLLMPLSFASILGGLITLIGTPPNIVIAHYRESVAGEPFSMFDFSPVGIAVAAVGIFFLGTVGWRFLPKDRQSKSATDDLYDIDDYVAECSAPEGSAAIGKTVKDIDDIADKCDVRIAGLIKNGRRILRLSRTRIIEENDIFILKTGPKELDDFAHKLGLEIKGGEYDSSLFSNDDVALSEAVVSADSRIIGRKIGEIRLKSRSALNLLGVSRQGQNINHQLHQLIFQAGDILLLQGDNDSMTKSMDRLGLLPLAGRGINMGKRKHAGIAVLLLAGAIGAAATGLTSLTISLAIAALGMVLFNIIPLRDLYNTIDWPVIVLVGSMIPIGGALETTGTTDLIASGILSVADGNSAFFVMAILFIVTMTLSDLMNNVATAVMMAPIAVSMAESLNSNPDAFLMAVAVSSSCAFLTPIGHKNNALIMGPGGYKFGDYWRMGLPLEVIITIVALPMIALVWPL